MHMKSLMHRTRTGELCLCIFLLLILCLVTGGTAAPAAEAAAETDFVISAAGELKQYKGSDPDVVILAVPSPFTRSTAAKMAPYVRYGQLIVSVAKGIEESTLETLSQVISDEIPQSNVAVLSGPTHAEEVGKGIPTTIVAGASDEKTAKYVQDIFMNEVFRVYTSPDMLGMQIGAALKNVIALGAGIADGLGYGDNTKAALITRGIHEIECLGVKMGGSPETFAGLTGIGDLIVTCASMHSRNRRAGILIGEGRTMEEATKEVGQIVEGIYSAKAALALAEKYGAPLPIIEEVNHVLFDGKSAKDAVRDLMVRERKMETDFTSEDLPECWRSDNSH